MLQGQGIQLGLQFAYFVFIAHVLGPSGYGTFVACTAVVLSLAPFSSWGTGQILVKYVARNRESFPTYFGNAIVITVLFGAGLTLILLLLRPVFLPAGVSPWMLGSVAIADLICTQLTATCNLAYQSLDQPRRSASVLISAAIIRFGAALLLLVLPISAAEWATLYLIAGVVSSVYQIAGVIRFTSRPQVDLKLITPSLREGFHFATSISAQTVYDNIDKTMLARLGNVESAAIYAVAYRFVDASMLPIRALAAATYPEFFRHGQQGVSGAFRFAKRILRRSVLYGAGVTAFLFIAAGLIPIIMGKGYATSSEALRWLCPLPLIKSVHSFLTDTLTGSDFQSERSTVQIGIAAFNVLINLWLIRVFSWRGAAWSSVITDFALMGTLYLLIKRHIRKEAQTPTAPALRV